MLTDNLVSEVDGQFLIYFAQVGLELLHCYNYVVCISKLVFTNQKLFIKACYYVCVFIGTNSYNH